MVGPDRTTAGCCPDGHVLTERNEKGIIEILCDDIRQFGAKYPFSSDSVETWFFEMSCVGPGRRNQSQATHGEALSHHRMKCDPHRTAGQHW